MEIESIDRDDVPDRKPGPDQELNGVEILQQTEEMILDPRIAEEIIDFTLKRMGVSGKELTLSIVACDAIQELNCQYRGLDEPTDVLSFRLADGPDSLFDGFLLGDIVICPSVIQKNASVHGSLLQETAMILIHGALHLAGLDHQGGMEDGEEFFTVQADILQASRSLWEESALISEGRCGHLG